MLYIELFIIDCNSNIVHSTLYNSFVLIFVDLKLLLPSYTHFHPISTVSSPILLLNCQYLESKGPCIPLNLGYINNTVYTHMILHEILINMGRDHSIPFTKILTHCFCFINMCQCFYTCSLAKGSLHFIFLQDVLYLVVVSSHWSTLTNEPVILLFILSIYCISDFTVLLNFIFY